MVDSVNFGDGLGLALSNAKHYSHQKIIALLEAEQDRRWEETKKQAIKKVVSFGNSIFDFFASADAPTDDKPLEKNNDNVVELQIKRNDGI